MFNLKILIFRFFKSYKFFIDPLLITSCKFYPTCSIYFKDVFYKYNFLFSIFLIIIRIIKCNKLFRCGYNSI